MQLLHPFLFPVGWNADMMVGVQTAVLDHEEHIEDGGTARFFSSKLRAPQHVKSLLRHSETPGAEHNLIKNILTSKMYWEAG